jgi:hypothetical protein
VTATFSGRSPRLQRLIVLFAISSTASLRILRDAGVRIGSLEVATMGLLVLAAGRLADVARRQDFWVPVPRRTGLLASPA